MTFQKVEKVKNDVGEGAKVTFAFTDITKVKADLDMQDLNPRAQAVGGEDDKDKDTVAFDFAKGSPAKLTVKMTHKSRAKDDDGPDPTEGPQFAQAAQMMKGMKMTMAIEVEGKIADTDAAHRDGSRVTLAEVPFDGLLKDPSKFKALNKAKEWPEALKVLKEVPGVKVEPKDAVTIQFGK